MLLDLSMSVGRRKRTKDHLSIAPSRPEECRQPPLASDDSQLKYTSERRRIVAQVRRKASKNNGFFASQNKFAGCDDLLTLGVDKVDRAGL
jgi:hypothetical protein